MFIHRTDGKSTDATGAIVDFIRVASSSGFGSTHLIGHELGHNLMSIARDAGVITEAQQKELDALFTDKNGKFDEEAFAEAFARELKRAFFETVQKRMEDVPATKAGRALRRVADFIATLARSFAFWRQERGLDPVTGQPLQAGQVLDAFLKRERTAVDEATRIANAARAAEARATQEAMANAPTQTVVDEDGTEVAYHERGGRDVSAEDFERTFGIRLAMDGDARSQDTANVCYDTLLKLAKLMGVPQETLGIGGLLTLDIAVVEELLNPVFHPTNNTINLTIPNNINVPEIATAATIVHEWTHALDRIVGLGRDADPNVEITEETTGALSHGIGPQVREELLQAGKRMTEALRNTRFYERISNDEEIKELDREDPEAQLFDPQEVFARALANYYLANELGRIPMFDEGLGPTMDELAEVGPILREFFDALEVGVNETTGVQTLYHISDSDRKNWDAMCDKLDSYAKLRAEGVPKEEALNQVFTKSEQLSHVQVFSGAPDVLRLINERKYGFGAVNGWQRFNERLPFKISVRDFAKIFGDTSGIELGAEHEHYLTRPQIRHLIDAIDDPLAIYVDPYDYDQRWGRIKDRSSGALIFLTELFEEREDGVSSPVIVPIKIRISNDDGRKHYRIMSAYGLNDKKKTSNHLRILTDAPGLILYANLGKLKELTEGGEKVESREQSENGNPPAYPPSRSRLGSDGLPVTRDTGLLTGILRVVSGYHATPESTASQMDMPLTEEFFTHPYFRDDFPNWGKPSMPSIIDHPASETQGGNKSDPNEERRDHISDGSGVSPEMDERYLDAVRNGDLDTARRMVEERATEMGIENPIPEQTDAYKVRVSAPPKKTIKVYKVFTIDQSGRPTALFVSGMDALPMGVWLDAQDTWHFTAKNGKQYIPSTANPNGRGGKTGTAVEIPNEATRQELIKRGFLPQGSKAKTVVTLAYRPGWHAGDMPFFPQGGVRRAGSNYGNVHHARQVVFECEMDADHDYTDEARRQQKALTKDGRVNEANADLQSMPEGGFYRYSTNPLTKGGKRGTWFISGSLKINRALTQGEADGILRENGFAPQEWEQGALDLAQLDYRGDESEAARKTLAPVTYDDNGEVIPLSERFNPENVDIRWHESEGAVLPRFTETPLGQELVAEAFDAIMGSRVDLLLRPSRYYGNPYETRDRNPRNALVTEHLHRDVDVSEPRGFATEVSAEISRFGTREGDPTLRDIRARCGSKERFYEVLGAVYETAEAIRSGLSEVVTGRERTMMSNAGLLAAEFIKHNATARATALGRKLYLMGREFAWKLYKEDIAAARAEAQAKVQEANAKTREAKAQTRNAERREETAKNQAYQNRWGLAEERFMREYERALLRHQAARKVSDVREKMQEQVDLLRLREAKKRALERERGVTFTALKATLGVDIPARLRALAGTQEDPFEAAAKLIAEIDDGFDKWVKRDRRDLLDGTEPYTYLNEQGERAYAETMGNVLKAVARDLSYGKLREALLNAADKIARAKPETVRVIVEGKLGRVARVLRLAQNADIVTLANRRIKSALAEANKRLSSANSGMRTRYMAAMRKQAKELIKTMQLAVSAQDNTKASEKKKQAMLAERARLADELNLIEKGETPEGLAKDETLTDRQHQDAVKLMFLEKFGDLSFTIDPAEVWAKAAEAEAFVVS